MGGPSSKPSTAKVRVNVDLKPREGLLSEINVIGMHGRSSGRPGLALPRRNAVTDLHEVRIVHGYGTGQLRKGIRAFLKTHPLV